MHPSNSSHNGNDDLLISYPDQAFSYKPFSIDSNPTSKQETNFALPPPPPLFHFPPSLFEDNEIFLQQQLLHHHHHDHHHGFLLHQQSLADAVVNNMDVSINKVPAKGGGHGMTNTEVIQMPRRRSCKRDRHSKIKTARGLRDRRMRLSLEVAKKFFGLQDLLGFDKASKTVEWLLNQSKVEIKQLAREKKNLNHQTSCNNSAVNIAAAGGGAKSASSTSECEGVSSLDEVAVSGNIQEQDNKGKPVIPPAMVKRRINKLISRKSAFFHPLAREFREKARERARERTREKMRTRRALAADHDESKQCSEATINHDLMRNQNQSLNNLSLDVMAEAEKPSSQAKEHLGTVEDMAHDDDSLATMMSKWSPSMIFNSLNNPGLLQEHQFAGFQTLGKPWEAYNSHI